MGEGSDKPPSSPAEGTALIFPEIGLEQWERFLRGQPAQQDLCQLLPPGGGGGRQDSSGLFEDSDQGFQRIASLLGPCPWQEILRVCAGGKEVGAQGFPGLRETCQPSNLSLIVTFMSLQDSEQVTRLSG